MMKTKLFLFTTLALTIIFSFISCDKVDDPANLNKVPAPLEEKIGRGIYNLGAHWDEVEYLTADPSQYVIRHYSIGDTVLPSFAGDTLEVFCDSLIIGKIVYNPDHTVKFANGKYSQNFELLYDFAAVKSQKYGEYDFYNDPYTDNFVPPTFSLFGSNPGKSSPSFKAYHSDGNVSYDWWWYWVNDAFGGKTISGLGSTAGILTPIVGKPAPGYTREVLQCYLQTSNKSHTYLLNENRPIFY
ncbi:MAG: hypothetical protein K2J74_00520, partial [Muribaculaceae bacterium]|nr:hypothetical protein [Muribaculaceae bacterium]